MAWRLRWHWPGLGHGVPRFLALTTALALAILLAAFARSGRRAAAAAAEGAAMYRFLADHSMDLITRHSSDGRIRFASPATLMLLGRAPETVMGLAPAALVHPEDLPALNAALMDGQLFRPPQCGGSAAAPR